ncbi:hypothetical protein B484DRAFT_401454, partial [Ochromonadaceae sp. CCMP2298]
NGPSATLLLRQKGFDRLVIGITANVLQADTDAFLLAGADCVILKPLSISRFKVLLAYVQQYGTGSLPQEKLKIVGDKVVSFPLSELLRE